MKRIAHRSICLFICFTIEMITIVFIGYVAPNARMEQ
jgi:hypothetical protein